MCWHWSWCGDGKPSRHQSRRCCGSLDCQATCRTESLGCLHPPRAHLEEPAINIERNRSTHEKNNIFSWIECTVYQRDHNKVWCAAFTFFFAARPLLLANLLLLSMEAARRRGDLPLLPPSGLSIHQELFPVPSFCTRINLLCRDRLCLIEFYGREAEQGEKA